MAFSADRDHDPSRCCGTGSSDGRPIILKLLADTGSWSSATASLNASQSQLNHHRKRIRPDAVVAVPPRGCSGLRRRRARSEVTGAAAVRVGRPVQGGAVRGPALRRERLDGLGPRVMATVLDDEKPDFVVYLGDLVTANNVPVPNATLYWDRAISPSRRRGIPWCTVFGNHDDMPFEWPPEWFSPAGIPPVHCPTAAAMPTSGSGCSFRGTPRIELMTAELNRDGCGKGLSHWLVGPRELWPSVSNYVLQVLWHEEHDPALLMYFLDSGGGSYPEVISSAQLTWFRSQSQFLNPDSRVPEIIFWHIPSTAYVKVAPKAKSEIRKPCVGSLNEEDVAPQVAEWGIMDALAKRSSVKAIFVGHNHGLDWCCPYEKLWLCFARHTGHGGYGDWPRGARIVEITEKPFSVESWIRMENGSTHSHVILS